MLKLHRRDPALSSEQRFPNMPQSSKAVSKSQFLWKRTLAVLAVFCVVGAIMYTTGLGEQIYESINGTIALRWKPQVQRRRYEKKRLRSFKYLGFLTKPWVTIHCFIPCHCCTTFFRPIVNTLKSLLNQYFCQQLLA